MADKLETTVAGLSAGAQQRGTEFNLLPMILVFMDGKVAAVALSAEVRGNILKTLDNERGAGRIGSGTMPDTYNPAVRAAEWEKTSSSLDQYLADFTDVEADGARVTSATVETLGGVLVRLELFRAHADPVEMFLDPIALERFEAALR